MAPSLPTTEGQQQPTTLEYHILCHSLYGVTQWCIFLLMVNLFFHVVLLLFYNVLTFSLTFVGKYKIYTK